MKITGNTLVLAVIFIMVSLTFNGVSAQTPPTEAMATYHWIEIMQGDNPDTTEIEDNSLVTVMDTMLYSIPYNVSRVYIHVPEGGTLTSFQDVHGTYNDTNFGVSEYENYYYWEFPPNADRSMEFGIEHHTTHFYDNGTFNTTLINVIDDQIKLMNGIDLGEFKSPEIDVPNNLEILSAKVRLNTDLPENVTIFLSNNDGINWIIAANDTYLDFGTSGTSLSYKLILNGTGVFRPKIFNVTVDYKYNPTFTEIGISARYQFSIDSEQPFFSMEKQLLYDTEKVNLLLFVDSGNIVEDENIAWVNESAFEPTMFEALQKPGKDFYMGIIEPGELFGLYVTPTSGSSNINTLYFLGLAVLIMLLIGLVLKLRKKKTVETTENNEETTTNEKDTGDGTELIEKKENILKAIKKLDKDLEEGSISEDVHEELKEKYKEEAIQIMKELDGN